MSLRSKEARLRDRLTEARAILAESPEWAPAQERVADVERAIAKLKPKKPRTKLASMSAKTKAKQPARRKCCAEVRRRSKGRCEVRHTGCTGKMDHTHEINPRSNGGSITDPENCLAMCASCHRWVHANANAARKLGFLK